jgi:MoaA/NifB/PqqE/SkfB family radical SAM enzyme
LEAKRIVDELVDCGIRGVMVTGGGEPMLNEHTPAVIEYIVSLGVDVALITNGGVSQSDKVWEKIKECCTWVRVSLDACNQEWHERVHGVKGKFDVVCSTLRQLVGVQGNATIGVGYLTDCETVRVMEEATKLVKALGVDYIQFRPIAGHRMGIERQLQRCQREQTGRFAVLSSARKYEHFGERKRPYSQCHAAHFLVVVQADGNVPICCNHRGNEEMYCGNVLRRSFSEVWSSERRAEILAYLDVQKCVPCCRGDGVNRAIEEVTKTYEHGNFL